MNKDNQPQYQQSIFETDHLDASGSEPLTCLCKAFENEGKGREYFLEKLREKFKDPEFRKIEGLPIGEDEYILALSDPPYYKACPNLWIDPAHNRTGFFL